MGMEHYAHVKDLGGTRGAFLAVDKQDATRLVVIKKLESIQGGGMSELSVSLRLQHPHIIQFLESFICDQEMYVVLKYERGGDLEELLSHLEEAHQAPTDLTIYSWCEQLLDALAYCHQQHVIHRDVKPGNVFLSEDHRTIILGDFGSAKALGPGGQDFTTTFVGSPLWISPEVIEGQPYTFSTDMWAMGCVMYEMTTLRKPFTSNHFARLVNQITSGDIAPLPPSVSPALRELIMSLLQLDPQKRPSAAAALEKVRAELVDIKANRRKEAGAKGVAAAGDRNVQPPQPQPQPQPQPRPTSPSRVAQPVVATAKSQQPPPQQQQQRPTSSPSTAAAAVAAIPNKVSAKPSSDAPVKSERRRIVIKPPIPTQGGSSSPAGAAGGGALQPPPPSHLPSRAAVAAFHRLGSRPGLPPALPPLPPHQQQQHHRDLPSSPRKPRSQPESAIVEHVIAAPKKGAGSAEVGAGAGRDRRPPSSSSSSPPQGSQFQRCGSADGLRAQGGAEGGGSSCGPLRHSRWLRARADDVSAIEEYLHQFRDHDDALLHANSSGNVNSPPPKQQLERPSSKPPPQPVVPVPGKVVTRKPPVEPTAAAPVSRGRDHPSQQQPLSKPTKAKVPPPSQPQHPAAQKGKGGGLEPTPLYLHQKRMRRLEHQQKLEAERLLERQASSPPQAAGPRAQQQQGAAGAVAKGRHQPPQPVHTNHLRSHQPKQVSHAKPVKALTIEEQAQAELERQLAHTQREEERARMRNMIRDARKVHKKDIEVEIVVPR